MTSLGNHGTIAFSMTGFFLLPLFGATFILNLRLLAYAYHEFGKK